VGGGVSITRRGKDTVEIMVQKNWEDEHRRRIEKEGRARVGSPPPLPPRGWQRKARGGEGVGHLSAKQAVRVAAHHQPEQLRGGVALPQELRPGSEPRVVVLYPMGGGNP